MRRPLSRLRLAALLMFPAAWLAGCATPPPTSDPEALADFKETNDPLEPTNRVMFKVNNAVDTVVLRPVAVGYSKLPQTLRDHTHNVLANLGQPVVLFNDMLQGKPRRAGDSLMRFVLNSTIGVAGIFDVATDWGWPTHEADFGLTLAIWGIGDGPFLYLPILGPTGPRDAVGFGTDIAMDPFTWIGAGQLVNGLGYARTGLNAIDTRAQLLDPIDKVKQQALDPYATFRSLYRQHRQSQVDNIHDDTRATAPTPLLAHPAPGLSPDPGVTTPPPPPQAAPGAAPAAP